VLSIAIFDNFRYKQITNAGKLPKDACIGKLRIRLSNVV
jgi:hypothetical protein